MATKLAMTATVKAMDIQRWICRTHSFQFTGTSSEDEPKADRAHVQVLRSRGSRDPREQVDELPAHHLPAVARATKVLLLVRLEARLHEGQAGAPRAAAYGDEDHRLSAQHR